MKCKITECACHDDCGIIEITKKSPKTKAECTYYPIFNSNRKLKRKQRTHIDTGDD